MADEAKKGPRATADKRPITLAPTPKVPADDAKPSDRPSDAKQTVDLNPSNPFSPLQPVAPFFPKEMQQARVRDYPTGFNLGFRPRQFELISFTMLETLANSLGVLRAIIETRKDQILRLPWEIRLVDKPEVADPRIDFLKKFFKKPDKQHHWHTWVRMVLEDLFVGDCPALLMRPSQLGVPYAVDVVDGTTITPLIDDFGRRPEPPFVAYQQILKGFPAVDMTSDQLIYAPMHVRPKHRPYGQSPVEQIYLEILQAIRREVYQLDYYNEGTIPDLMVTVPDTWSPAQVAEFQAAFDALMTGNMHLRSKVRFMPGGSKPFELKGAALKTEYDEWLVRIICFAFSIPPSPFIKQLNRATAETAQEVALEEGLLPLQAWFRDDIMNVIIQEHFGWEDIEFAFIAEEELDQLKEAQILKILVEGGMLTPDEARERLGEDAKGADELIIVTAGGVQPLKEGIEAGRALAERTIDPPAAGEPGGPPIPVVAPGKAGGAPPGKAPATPAAPKAAKGLETGDLSKKNSRRGGPIILRKALKQTRLSQHWKGY